LYDEQLQFLSDIDFFFEHFTEYLNKKYKLAAY